MKLVHLNDRRANLPDTMAVFENCRGLGELFRKYTSSTELKRNQEFGATVLSVLRQPLLGLRFNQSTARSFLVIRSDAGGYEGVAEFVLSSAILLSLNIYRRRPVVTTDTQRHQHHIVGCKPLRRRLSRGVCH